VQVLEKHVDARVVRWFKREYPDGVCIKLAMAGAHGTSGWLDRLFLANGHAAFVELKAPGKEPTPLQYQRIKELRAAGHQAEWFDNAGAAIEWIDAVLHGDRP
jgi:hypothetical protein